MKKLLLILSALLIISSCQVETIMVPSPCSPVEEDVYSDGIYLFYANCCKWLKEIEIEYLFEDDEIEKTKKYYIYSNEARVSEVFKVDLENLKLIRINYKMNPSSTMAHSEKGNIDKTSFLNLENGLYVVEFYGIENTSDTTSEVFLRKTKSVDYYLINENFYDNKNILFIKNNYQDSFFIDYAKKATGWSRKYIKKRELRGFVIYNPLPTEYINGNGKHKPVDYSILKHGENIIDLTQLGTGYYYAEIDTDGNFTTPVKLNSYKDIINN